MKEIYEKPKTDLVEFKLVDCITTSSNDPDIDIGGDF